MGTSRAAPTVLGTKAPLLALATLILGVLLGLGAAQLAGSGGPPIEASDAPVAGPTEGARTAAPDLLPALSGGLPKADRPAPAPPNARAEAHGADGASLAGADLGLVGLVRTRVASEAFATRFGPDAEALMGLAFDLELRLHGASEAAALLEGPETSSALLRRGSKALEAEFGIASAAPLLRRLVERQVEGWLAADPRNAAGEPGAPEESEFAWDEALALLPFDVGGAFVETDGLGGADWARYAKADPAGALSLGRDVFSRLGPPLRAEFGALLVQHMEEMGLLAEAGATVATLLAEQPERIDLLGELARLDPAAAESRIRSRMAAALPEEAEPLRSMLAGLLAREGRTSEALALVRAALPADLSGEQLEWALAEQSDLARALTPAQIADLLGGPPTTPGLVQHIVQNHVAAGDFDAALGAWAAVVDRVTAGQDPGWLPALPERLARERGPELRALAQRLESLQTENDEVLGDLGDLWVMLGDHEAALRIYTRAASIDPSDSEWTNALRNTRARLRGQ